MNVDYREKVVGFINTHGPSLPMQIGKHMGMNSMLAGAMLSELVSKGVVKISRMKVGGSPLYYAPGQEAQLFKFIEYLQEKEREAVQLLEKEKILRDNQLQPVVRAALRSVPDFAIPLDVTYNEQKETFWKWCVLPDTETAERIKGILQPARPVQRETPKAEARQPERQSPPAQMAPVAQSHLEGYTPQPASPVNRGDPSTDDFLAKLLTFFTKNNIKILEQQCLKKKAEYDFVLKVPSPVGELTYYCKAKSKQKLGDSDVSAAFVQGQLRKLPVLLISPGELAKKAQDLVQHDLHGLTFKRME